MYQFSFEEHKLGGSYTILKFRRKTLREFSIKSVGEGATIIFFKYYHKIEARRLPNRSQIP